MLLKVQESPAAARPSWSKSRDGRGDEPPFRCLWNARCYEGGQQRQCCRDTATFLIGVGKLKDTSKS